MNVPTYEIRRTHHPPGASGRFWRPASTLLVADGAARLDGGLACRHELKQERRAPAESPKRSEMPSPLAFAKLVMNFIATNPQLKGRLGLLAYSSFLCVWTTLALPTTPLEIIAGFNFSLAGSTIAGLMGKTCGSVLAFVIGRSLLGPCRRMFRWLRGQPAAPKEEEVPSGLGAKLEAALRKRPLQTIGMIRVAPLPGGRERPLTGRTVGRTCPRHSSPRPSIHPSIHQFINQFFKARSPKCGASRDP